MPLRARVPLPVERGIAIRLDGRETLVRDRTSSALVNGARLRGDAMVAPDAEFSTERGPWRVYEALGELNRLPRTILLNGTPAGLLAAMKSGDEVVTS